MQIKVSIAQQRLQLFDNNQVIMDTLISTARNGAGEDMGSERTPRGWHTIRAKIGEDCPTNTVFVGRRPTGEIYSPELARKTPDRDWILTRILWLSGLETGKNRGSTVDTMRRYIYIHGSPSNDVMGRPSSHGCVKMTNQDIKNIYDKVETGVRVIIIE